MMASELARRGIPVRIVDRSPGIDPHVRGNLLHTRTLEILQGLDLADRTTEGSFEEHGVRLYVDGKLVANQRHQPVDSPFPFGMSQSQAKTEAVLEAHLSRFGVTVERGVSLRAVSDTEESVTATLEHPDGRREIVETPWLVGCDGAHSAVRHLTGTAFPGDADPYQYVLADVVVDGSLEDNDGYFFLNDTGELFLFTALPGRRRLIAANVPVGHQMTEPPTLAQMQRLVDERGLPELRLCDPQWLASFRIHYRLAPHYRVGRVFLAGDAAHVHSPLGGHGMNTGIQDAYNLGWKLALVIRGIAPDWWLDTYESERRRVAEDVVATTRAATEQAERFANVSNSEREKIVAHLLVPESERLDAARHLQEIDLDYRSSPLCIEGEGEFSGGARPGALAPDATPIEVDGKAARSVFALFGGTEHRLFLFGVEEAAESVTRAAAAAVVKYGSWVEVYLVTVAPLAGPRGVQVIRDPEGTMHARYGAKGRCLYLVRPDGHVAYRDRRLESLSDYVDRVL